MPKKKYSKCECCPYYKLDFTHNRWGCDRRDGGYVEKKCIFAFHKTGDEDMEKFQKEVLERWINANKE